MTSVAVLFVVTSNVSYCQSRLKTDTLPPNSSADSLCHLDNLPSIKFAKGSALLTQEAKAILNDVAQELKENPYRNIMPSWYNYGASAKKQLNLEWNRVNAIIKYLVDYDSLYEGRITFGYDMYSDTENVVRLKPSPMYFKLQMPAPNPFKLTKRFKPPVVDYRFYIDAANSVVKIPYHYKHKGPPAISPDADGDGIIDQIDLEPNTPLGAAIDSHGRALDTDGDGVPDYKDKEVLTMSSCFPVDSSGVGVCLELPCCQPSMIVEHFDSCYDGGVTSVEFKMGSTALSKHGILLLDSALTKINAINCRIKIVGYVPDATSENKEQISWDKVFIVREYLKGKGISKDRFIFSYGNPGDPNIIDLIPTTEEGPHIVPAPHPVYSTLKNVNWHKIFEEYSSQLQQK